MLRGAAKKKERIKNKKQRLSRGWGSGHLPLGIPSNGQAQCQARLVGSHCTPHRQVSSCPLWSQEGVAEGWP